METKVREMLVVDPHLAEAFTGHGWVRVTVLGLLGQRVVLRWEHGPRMGALGWLPLKDVRST